MGLFGGKNEDELRASGTPTPARVTYVDDTGKRRDGGAWAKVRTRVQIDSGSARGREIEKAKWVPAARVPRVGDHVQIRFDPDHVSDWAWGDAAMYSPPAAADAAPPPEGFDPFGGFGGFGRVGQVIDLTGDPAAQQQVIDQLRAYGVDLRAMQAVTNSAGADNTAVKLRHLDELHRQGVLSDDEHRRQRQRIIDAI